MKLNKNLNQRPWQPLAWITESGLLLTAKHVTMIGKDSQSNAARETTAIIQKMMRT